MIASMIRTLNFVALLTGFIQVTSVGTSGAAASGFCAEVRSLVEASSKQSSNTDLSSLFKGSSEPFGVPTSCNVSKGLSGNSSTICFWTFTYRSTESAESFETLNDMITQCLGPEARVVSDQPVNHPDTYDLRTYVSDNTSLSASIKDKAALEKTFIFLQVGE